jgi:hypothetical protein
LNTYRATRDKVESNEEVAINPYRASSQMSSGFQKKNRFSFCTTNRPDSSEIIEQKLQFDIEKMN